MKKILFTLFLIINTFFRLNAQCGSFNANVTGLSTSRYQVCEGSASISVAGGSGSYNYYWFPGGQDSSAVTTLCQGDHKVFVIDSISGCKDTVFFTVLGAPNPCIGFHASIIATDATSIDSCNGTATFNIVGGVPPFDYWWDWSTPHTVSTNNVCPGPHGVTCIDSNGCFSNAYFDINYPGACPLFKATANVTNVSAPGIMDGSAYLTLTNGSAPFVYDWWTIAETGATISGKGSDVYPVKVTDSAGCEAYAFASIECSGFTTAVVSQDCVYSGCADGFVYIAPSGGVPPYTYDWWSKTSSMTTYYHSGDVVDTIGPRNSYWQFLGIAQDSQGCKASNYGQVHDPIEPTPCDNQCATCNGLTLYYATDQNTCDGVVDPPGGWSPGIAATPYSYYWPATNSYSNQIDSAVCPNQNLLCILTDSRGCESYWPGYMGILNYVDTEPLLPDTTRSLCIGSAKALVASTFPPFSYLWDDGENSSTATQLCVGLHSVIVYDNHSGIDTAYVVTSNLQHTYLNHQLLPSPHYIYTPPINNCSIPYADISNIIIDSVSIQGPDKVNVIWRIDYATTHPSDYITRLYYVIPNNVVEFIVGIYCDADTGYVTARDRIDFGGSTAGIAIQNMNIGSVQIYPNPFKNQVTIIVENFSKSKILITDAFGRIVYNDQLIEKNTIISTDDYSPGMYFVNVISEMGAVSNSKMIKIN